MPRVFLTILIFIAYGWLLSCAEQAIVEDPSRQVSPWTPPADFRPSYITRDDDSLYWGLFISRRYSAKFNLWAVKSSDRETWFGPLLIDNAYYCRELDFSVHNDSLHFVFHEIDPGYFPDHGLGLGDYVDNKDELELAFAVADLARDRDLDNIPDNVEKELLTSDRLPDSDLDGKPDSRDFCPMGRPRSPNENQKIYQAVLWEIIKSSGLDSLQIRMDTAWTKYFQIYVLAEPNPLYVAFAREQRTFEMAGFPMPLITVRTPLWFGSRTNYKSLSEGIIPHLNFKALNRNFLKNQASVILENYSGSEQDNDFRFQLKKNADRWEVIGVYLIKEDKQTSDSTDTARQSESTAPR